MQRFTIVASRSSRLMRAVRLAVAVSSLTLLGACRCLESCGGSKGRSEAETAALLGAAAGLCQRGDPGVMLARAAAAGGPKRPPPKRGATPPDFGSDSRPPVDRSPSRGAAPTSSTGGIENSKPKRGTIWDWIRRDKPSEDGSAKKIPDPKELSLTPAASTAGQSIPDPKELQKPDSPPDTSAPAPDSAPPDPKEIRKTSP